MVASTWCMNRHGRFVRRPRGEPSRNFLSFGTLFCTCPTADSQTSSTSRAVEDHRPGLRPPEYSTYFYILLREQNPHENIYFLVVVQLKLSIFSQFSIYKQFTTFPKPPLGSQSFLYTVFFKHLYNNLPFRQTAKSTYLPTL